MRITMVNKHYPPHLGGVEFHVRDLAEALAARGHEVRALVAAESGDGVTETINGVEVIRLPMQVKASSTPVALAMRGAIRRLAAETDVFHLHFPYPWGEVSWLAAATHVPTALTYHSDIVRQRKALALYKPLLERVLDRVDVIMASSPNMVEHSEFLAPRAEKCQVIPFGIHVENYQPTPEVVARAEAIRAEHAGRKIVLFVGRLIYYKGADVLMRAMADVDADLLVVGTGPLEEELRHIAAESGITERVTFLPPVDDFELRALYRAADIFCLPSVARSEAFGLVQLEAHASGTPVVSTTLTTGVPYVNQDGVTGLTVPPGDAPALARALSTLVANDALRLRLGEQAQARALADFSIDRMTEQVAAVYEGLLGLH